MKNLATTLPLLAAIASPLAAQGMRVNVTIENLAPANGTFATPFWVGFHDGTFDTYDGGTLASSLPMPNSIAIESIAEDGNTGPLMSDFAALALGRVDATIPGPNGPVAPGEAATMAFLLDPSDVRDRYFSYASMVIPSNDTFVANGNPMAHPIFDSNGNFVASDFFVAGQNAANDAGTEVNDELPMNTAFFGQMAPNTGVTENAVITTAPGFNAPGTGGILDAPRFRNGDYTLGGYPFLRVGFKAAPAVTDVRTYSTFALGGFQVPPVATSAIALSGAALLDDGTRIMIVVQALGLADLTAAHLHLGGLGTNGPVVADLLANTTVANMPNNQFFVAEIRTADLTGPLASFPLDELIRRIEGGMIYLNLHSTAHPNGEIRGQVVRFN
ncbi:MAG: CHRD domain-containing protein [bacterium]|nr:CHRD domain-containing protein [bacterium]